MAEHIPITTKTRQISADSDIVVLLRKKGYTVIIKFKTRGTKMTNERATGTKKIIKLFKVVLNYFLHCP